MRKPSSSSPALHVSAPPAARRAAVAALLLAVRCLAASPPAAPGIAAVPAHPPSMIDNPLLAECTLPYHLPPFDRIKDEHFAPAYEQGMADELKEVAAIAANPEPPSFDNTIVALERSGRLRKRVDQVFSNLNSANTDPVMLKVQSDMAPRLSAQQDAIHLDGALFARIQALHEQRDRLGLDAESKRLLERYYKDFVRAGARLPEADQTRLKALNAEIASLETAFSQNVLKETNASAIVVNDRAQLAGLSASEIAAAEAAAGAEKRDGKFVIRLLNTSGQPALASLEDRALRERIHEASVSRGRRGGEFDNRAVVLRLARLRAEQAALLDYENHAAYVLEDQTAGTPAAVNRLLAELAPPAVANARREAADMQALIDREHGGFPLAAWDWDFYSEKVRRARYAFDESELRPYFELNQVLIDGVFYAAGRLYGLTFKERRDLPVYQADVRVFEVFDADGRPLALFLADCYARPSKRGGAWMNTYVDQSELLGTRPVVANHFNIPRPPPGEPALLTYDEVRTMFHEFGHALHGMFSHVKYPRFSGTEVPRDFVEYPSQVNEMWAVWPEVVKNYARHYRTGEPMPPALLGKMLATQKFNQGFATTEYLAAALLDMAWHQLKPGEVPADEPAFEATALRRAGVDFAPVPPRYHSTYFLHIFSDDNYSAGYYSYIWAEVLDADSVEWFKQHGGLTRANGDRFRQTVLSRGGSEEAMTLFRDFTGGDPDIEPLLKRRGLDHPAEKHDPAAFN
ncbi:MAG: M3 family metallopeptidase [Opitutaceae bacterium]|nr:M3 family metallopeptidase [Opitutaceae bacterium]